MCIYDGADEPLRICYSAAENYQLLLGAVAVADESNERLKRNVLEWLNACLEVNGDSYDDAEMQEMKDTIEYARRRL